MGEALATVLGACERPVLIIASSDMNHYEDDATTRVKDRKAIKQILALNPRGLYETVMNESISMCGFGPAVAMLTAAKRLGAQRKRTWCSTQLRGMCRETVKRSWDTRESSCSETVGGGQWS